jgi:hypothetical protein
MGRRRFKPLKRKGCCKNVTLSLAGEFFNANNGKSYAAAVLARPVPPPDPKLEPLFGPLCRRSIAVLAAAPANHPPVWLPLGRLHLPIRRCGPPRQAAII